MKTKKTYNVFNKIRAALRDIWRYSPQHREAIKKISFDDPELGKFFNCPLCHTDWPLRMAQVDHDPPLGTLYGFYGTEGLGDWTDRLFNGPVRVICALCHKSVTKEQRKLCKKS